MGWVMVYALQYGFIIDKPFISIKFDEKIDQKYGIIQYVMVGAHNHDVLREYSSSAEDVSVNTVIIPRN